uniref:Uncharacterized protein n=1 Tax=Pyxicephalus adspersus TaxID=30357 RepID=A0AAV3AYM8_PYXAD|nr:TPA: hypothetical protein GDO54_011483 [Pyxicephalus adspersus]
MTILVVRQQIDEIAKHTKRRVNIQRTRTLIIHLEKSHSVNCTCTGLLNRAKGSRDREVTAERKRKGGRRLQSQPLSGTPF